MLLLDPAPTANPGPCCSQWQHQPDPGRSRRRRTGHRGRDYRLPAQPVMVGTRDGASQFLDPLQPATSPAASAKPVTDAANLVEQRWSQDERYLAPTRAIAGHTTVLDAAYNAAAAAAAGGTHTYLNGVVLRVEPDKPVLRSSTRRCSSRACPTRAEDVVYVAIRTASSRSYNPGQVVNLRDVVMDQQKTDIDGSQPRCTWPTPRSTERASSRPAVSICSHCCSRACSASTRTWPPGSQAGGRRDASPQRRTPSATQVPQQVIVQQRGPSFVDDFLIWMWLSNTGFYRGPSVIINNPPPSSNRPGDSTYYSPPPTTSGTNPSTVARRKRRRAARRSKRRARPSRVSPRAQAAAWRRPTSRRRPRRSCAGAATAKAASVAGDVSAASTGKSAASVAEQLRIVNGQSERGLDVGRHARQRRFVQLQRLVVLELQRPKLVVQLVQRLRQQQWQRGHRRFEQQLGASGRPRRTLTDAAGSSAAENTNQP